ncbi:hypothetical protein PVMG_05631 [Plasmodium vivax Mauritania I]|uniref:Uncharacterized protein n=1 Tax=Plasmodium vivax Mauritania I TaxID=1035515 RepID=A0A0J9TJN3_PLAVI|nr:hypothetical protein PVMG_05631 [Plasmodium vivax Mauritania I]
MGDHLTKDDIKKLTSYYNYSKFEDGKEGCENFDFYSSIRDEISESYPYLKTISENILRALCYIYKKKKDNPGSFEEELCLYLYYWLGNKIYPFVRNKILFSKIIDMIYGELYSKITDIIVCKPNNPSIDQERFNDNKVLFDYSKDYQYIEIVTAPGTTTCDRIYKDYIEKYKDIYRDAYSNCRGKKDKKYECDKYEEIFNENLYNKLSSFSCRYNENDKAVFERQSRPEEQETALALHFTPPSVNDTASDYRRALSPILSKHQSSRSLEAPGSIQELSNVDNSEGGSTKTIAGSIVPVLGVSSFSLLLYKVIKNKIDLQEIIVYT